jgi:hypothetical protein
MAHIRSDNSRLSEICVHSQNRIEQFVSMSELRLVIAGIEVCASGGPATVVALDLDLGRHIIVPSSVFFRSLAATLDVTCLGLHAFQRMWITSVIIPRHVQILCSYCFSDCSSLSSISFESDSELTRIESNAFYSCSSLKSITIPRHVQILCSSCFSDCKSPSSISFETDSELVRIETRAFAVTRTSSAVVPGSVSFIAGEAFLVSCAFTLAGGC